VILSDPTGLTLEETDDAGGVFEALAEILGGEMDPGLLRPVGPVRVCAASASQEVLEAIATYAGAGRGARRFAQTLIEARTAKGELTQADLDTAQNAGDIAAQDRPIVNRLITIKPELWAMVVDVYDPERPEADGGPSSRYGARFELPVNGAARTSSTMQSNGKFLSWEELPIR
jgi:hypothetical protein